jgi:hypothetical protein
MGSPLDREEVVMRELPSADRFASGRLATPTADYSCRIVNFEFMLCVLARTNSLQTLTFTHLTQ